MPPITQAGDSRKLDCSHQFTCFSHRSVRDRPFPPRALIGRTGPTVRRTADGRADRFGTRTAATDAFAPFRARSNQPFLRWPFRAVGAQVTTELPLKSELYDKDKDPAEMANLLTSEEHLAVPKSLKAEREQHRTNVLER